MDRDLSAQRQTVTRMLSDLADGRADASRELFSMVYDQLREIANAQFRNERREHTLQPTALVHEAFLKLVDRDGLRYESRAEFFKLASRAMRNILVDHARTKNRDKRGGGRNRVGLDQAEQGDFTDAADVLAIDEALQALADLDERKAHLVELRFFGGLGADEAAEVLGVARSTAASDWRMARAWLQRRLRDDTDE